MKKVLTLSYIIDSNKVLLGYKKKGFGQGRWNGFGGKVENGESIKQAAMREIKEECGLDAKNLEAAGIIEFSFIKNPEEILEVNLFRSFNNAGEIIESEEMRPEWFNFDKIPYEDMWDDDQYWLADFLAGKNVKAKFLFDENDKVIKKEINFINI
jgi:8-oxo-dGTP diphosphatase / 2-hydroxy-dATP diphosphatase